MGITCADYPKSQEFYDSVLGVLGFSRQLDFGRAIGYGRDGKPSFWISDGAGMGPNRENHIAFEAVDENAVRAFHRRRWNGAPSRCTSHDCGPNITRVTSARSCATLTAITSKRSGTGARRVAGMSNTDAAAQELLRDAFTRLIEHVDDLTVGLTDELSSYRPTPNANSIAWLIWHSARVQDIQLAHVAGVEEVWTRDGWVDRFGLELPRNDTGYGHGPAEVAKVQVPADLLSGYYHEVHKLTLSYIAGVTAAELSRVVDTNWDPPVTASARLVSIIDDCAQHLGQAAYLRGIAQ
jgi:catechol 2,3-dioxygenase-like lactoylglutathione lyase family enzyme